MPRLMGWSDSLLFGAWNRALFVTAAIGDSSLVQDIWADLSSRNCSSPVFLSTASGIIAIATACDSKARVGTILRASF